MYVEGRNTRIPSMSCKMQAVEGIAISGGFGGKHDGPDVGGVHARFPERFH